MISLFRTARATRLLITGDNCNSLYNELHSIPGVQFKDGVLTAVKDIRLAELLIDYGESLDAEAQEWYDLAQGEEESKRVLLSSPPVLDHPNGERLFDYQQKAASYLSRVSGILADEPGLGKTATSIIAVESARWYRKNLVVCPNSLKLWWAEEISRWSKDSAPIEVYSAKTRGEIIVFRGGWAIINYESFRKEEEFQEIYWDWVILDEAHRIKNRKTKTFKACKQLKYRRAILLTGTPYGNNPAELWSLLNFLYPKRYTSYWRFFEMYVHYVADYWGARTILGVKNVELLRRDLATVMLRRTKEEVRRELPPKIYQTIPVEMTSKQKTHYRSMAKEFLIRMQNGELLHGRGPLSVLTRLRQILSTTANFDLPDLSGKLDAAVDLIKDSTGGVLVFSIYRATVSNLVDRLSREKIAARALVGGTHIGIRKELVDDFNAGEYRVLVSTMEAGGVGLNLPKAETVIFIDKHWNPNKQAQAEDRAHRLTSVNAVRVISLLCPSTVDDVVEAILRRKISMIDAVLAESLMSTISRNLKR